MSIKQRIAKRGAKRAVKATKKWFYVSCSSEIDLEQVEKSSIKQRPTQDGKNMNNPATKGPEIK